MTKLNKISEPEDKNSLKNYELGRLIKLDQGITTLFNHLFYADINLGDKDHQALQIVLSLQSDVQEEIKLRIPGVDDNDGFITW